MKKIKTTACALALILGCLPLAACGSQDTGAGEGGNTDVETAVPLPPQPEDGENTEQPDQPETEQPEETPDQPETETPEETEPPAEEEPDPEPEEPEPLRAEYIHVRTDGLNVRAGAGTSYASLGTVESDILMQYVGKAGNWYETRYKNKTAYVSADARYTSLTSLDTADEKVERVIEQGLRFIGVPYVYGAVRLHDGAGNFLNGFTAAKFDCSSLMQYIFYYGAGINLNVTSRTQVSQGVSVAKENIQRGDLLFFTNATRYDYTGIERVGHVALYLGDNYILHTASDYAKIEQISTTRWSYFITARRMF